MENGIASLALTFYTCICMSVTVVSKYPLLTPFLSKHIFMYNCRKTVVSQTYLELKANHHVSVHLHFHCNSFLREKNIARNYGFNLFLKRLMSLGR